MGNGARGNRLCAVPRRLHVFAVDQRGREPRIEKHRFLNPRCRGRFRNLLGGRRLRRSTQNDVPFRVNPDKRPSPWILNVFACKNIHVVRRPWHPAVDQPNTRKKHIRVIRHEVLERLVGVNRARFERHDPQRRRTPDDNRAVVQLLPSLFGGIRYKRCPVMNLAWTHHLVVRALNCRHRKKTAVDSRHCPRCPVNEVENPFPRRGHQRLRDASHHQGQLRTRELPFLKRDRCPFDGALENSNRPAAYSIVSIVPSLLKTGLNVATHRHDVRRLFGRRVHHREGHRISRRPRIGLNNLVVLAIGIRQVWNRNPQLLLQSCLRLRQLLNLVLLAKLGNVVRMRHRVAANRDELILNQRLQRRPIHLWVVTLLIADELRMDEHRRWELVPLQNGKRHIIKPLIVIVKGQNNRLLRHRSPRRQVLIKLIQRDRGHTLHRQ